MASLMPETRSQTRSTAAMLAENAPQAMREYLAPHVPEYCERLLSAMRDPEAPGFRTAMQLIAQILRAVGVQMDVTVTVLAQLGVASVEEASERIQFSNRAASVTLEAAEARAVELLKAVMQHSPERRAAIRSELFGDMVTHANGGTAAPTNGHNGATNGHTNGNGKAPRNGRAKA